MFISNCVWFWQHQVLSWHRIFDQPKMQYGDTEMRIGFVITWSFVISSTSGFGIWPMISSREGISSVGGFLFGSFWSLLGGGLTCSHMIISNPYMKHEMKFYTFTSIRFTGRPLVVVEILTFKSEILLRNSLTSLKMPNFF